MDKVHPNDDAQNDLCLLCIVKFPQRRAPEAHEERTYGSQGAGGDDQLRRSGWNERAAGDTCGGDACRAGCKLSQFTRICKGPGLRVMFSGIKICVSSSMPIGPYP
jgi:hypothetical protein